MALVYVFSGDCKASAGMRLLDSVARITLCFLHERMWNSISFGRAK